MQLQDLDIAENMLALYARHRGFYEFSKFNASGKPEDVSYVESASGQFAIRALFTRAVIEFLRAKVLKGKARVEGLTAALGLIVEGVKAAEKEPRLHFLMYNGSVYFWRICRKLQMSGLRTHLAPLLETMTHCLSGKYFGGGGVWRAQYLMSYSLCLAESGKTDEALKVLGEAQELGGEGGRDLADTILSMKVHLAQTGKGNAKGQGAGDAETEAKAAIQYLKSADISDAAGVGKDIEARWEEVDPDPSGGVRNVNLLLVADLAWVAAEKGCLAIAKRMLERAREAKSLQTQGRVEMTTVLVALKELGESRFRITRPNVSKHITFLGTLEKALDSLLHIKSASAVQDCCTLIWNVGLPLLQSELRHNVKRPFLAAAAALENIDSQMHRLRAQLHLEVARCFMDEDLLVNATQEVHSSFSLDYVAEGAEIEASGHARPLDRFLVPLERQLKLKCAIYDDPDDGEEAVLLLVEKAKEMSVRSVREDYLEKAIRILASLPIGGEDAREEVEEGAKGRQARNRTISRIRLWGDIATTGWEAKLHKIVRKACPYALKDTSSWDPAVDFETIRYQGELSFIDAQACIMAIEEKEAGIVAPPVSAPPVDDDPLDPYQDVNMRAAAGFLRGMKMANRVHEYWMAVNGAVLVFNHYILCIRGEEYAKLEPMLRPVFEELLLIPEEATDADVVCTVATYLACGIEHKYLLGSSPTGEKRYSALQKEYASSRTKGEAAKAVLEEAARVCQKAMAKARNSPAKELMATLARIQRMRGEAVDGGVPQNGGDQEHISKAISMIEILNNPAAKAADRLDAVSAASESLKRVQPMDLDMWTQVIQAAFAAGQLEGALRACKEALQVLPEDGVPPGGRPEVSDHEWSLLSVCESYCGMVIASTVASGIEQEERIKCELLQQTCRHYVRAALYANFAHDQDLLVRAGQLMWNACMSHVGHPSTRVFAAEYLGQYCDLVEKKASHIAEGNLPFVVGMYRLLLQSLIDAERWLDGMKRIDSVFRCLPSPSHKHLWDLKVLFMTKMHHSVVAEVSSISEFSANLQAKIYDSLARSDVAYDQAIARHKPVEVLHEPWLKARYLIDYAEWLYETGGDLVDAEDAVHVAIYILMSAGDDVGPSSPGHPGTQGRMARRASAAAAGARRFSKPLSPTKVLSTIDKVSEQRKGERLADSGAEGLAQGVRAFLALARMLADDQQLNDFLLVAQKVTVVLLGNALRALELEEEVRVPESAAGWINFSLTDEVLVALRQDESAAALHRVDQIEVLLSNLLFLEESLRENMLHVQAIPVCHAFVALSSMIPSKGMADVGFLKAAVLMEAIGAAKGAEALHHRVGEFHISWQEKDDSKATIQRQKYVKAVEGGPAATNSYSSWAVLKPLDMSHVWMHRARYLMHRCDYALAKEVLEAALGHAEQIGDHSTTASIMLGIAECDFHLGNLDQAVETILQAQKGSKYITLWKQSALLYAKVQMARRDGQVAAREHLEDIMGLLRHIEENAAFNSTHLQKAVAAVMLELGRLYFVESEEAGESGQFDLQCQYFEDAVTVQNEACGLAPNGPESVRAAMEYARILTCDPRPMADKRGPFQEAQSILKRAVETAHKVLKRAMPVASMEAVDVHGPGISLPAERLLASVRAMQVEFNLKVLGYNFMYSQEQDSLEDRPPTPLVGQVPEAVQEYLQEHDPKSSHRVLDLAEEAVVLASEAVNLSHRSEARPLLLLGQSFMHKSIVKASAPLWTVRAPGEHRRQQAAPEEAEGVPEGEGPVAEGEEAAGGEPPSEEAAAGADAPATPKDFNLSLGVKTLEECRDMCIAEKDWNTALAATRALMWWGNHVGDQTALLENLCSSQSCRMVSEHLGLYVQATSNVEAQLLRMQEMVRGKLLQPSKDPYLMPWSDQLLQGMSDMAGLCCSLETSFKDSLALLPHIPSTVYVVLHVASGVAGLLDGPFLYVSGFRFQGAEGDEIDLVSDRVPFDVGAFARALEGYRRWRSQVGKTIRSLQSIAKVDHSDGENEPPKAEAVEKAGQAAPADAALNDFRALNRGWEDHLQAFKALLAPIEGSLGAALRRGEAPEGAPPTAAPDVVLMVDKALAPIPFEAMEVFAGCASVTREFCLHMMASRLKRLGGSFQAPLDAAQYLVDMKYEDHEASPRDKGRASGPLVEAFNNRVLKAHGGKWEGRAGSSTEHVGEEEAAHLIAGSQTLVFCGMHRFLSNIAPRAIANLNLRKCRLAVVVDNMSNETSARRQLYLDNRKTPEERSLEEPYEAAALLMLRGTSCVITNTLDTLVDNNVEFLDGLMAGIHAGSTAAAATRAAAQRLGEKSKALAYAAAVPVVYGIGWVTK